MVFLLQGVRGIFPLQAEIVQQSGRSCGAVSEDMWEHIQCLLFLCKFPVGDLRVLAA